MQVNYLQLPLLVGSAMPLSLVADTTLSGQTVAYSTYRLVLTNPQLATGYLKINGILFQASDHLNHAEGLFVLANWPFSFISVFRDKALLSNQWEAIADGSDLLLIAKKASSLLTLTIDNGTLLSSSTLIVTGQAGNNADEFEKPKLSVSVRLIDNQPLFLAGPNATNDPAPGTLCFGKLESNLVIDGIFKLSLANINAHHRPTLLPSVIEMVYRPDALLGVYLEPEISYGLYDQRQSVALINTVAPIDCPAYYVLPTTYQVNQFNRSLPSDLGYCTLGNDNQHPLNYVLPYRVFYPGLLTIEASWLLLMEGISIQIAKMELVSVWRCRNTTDLIEIVLSTFEYGQNGQALEPGYYQSASLGWVENQEWYQVHEISLFLRLEDQNKNTVTIMKDQLRYRPSLVDTSSTISIGFMNSIGGTEVLTFWPVQPGKWSTAYLPDFYEPVFEGFKNSPWHYQWKDLRNPFQFLVEIPEAIQWQSMEILSFETAFNLTEKTMSLVIQF
jgi:hypothetical protein